MAVTDYICHYQSPLGNITLASDGEALTGLWFDGQRHFAAGLSVNKIEQPDLAVFEETKRWLDCYFGGKPPAFTPHLTPRGTDFQREVWQVLLTISYGTTMTYGQVSTIVARRLGRNTMSAQAVGNAVSRNPISIIIPCHRVVGADGNLVGYAAGLDRKIRLLTLEKTRPFSCRMIGNPM